MYWRAGLLCGQETDVRGESSAMPKRGEGRVRAHDCRMLLQRTLLGLG